MSKDEEDNIDEELMDTKIIDKKIDIDNIRLKEDNALKLVETVLDEKTRLILFSLITKGYIDELSGAISTGKEANVYYARYKNTGRAVKIYRIDAPSFRRMKPYVKGDYRFRDIPAKRSGFIEMWAKKEFKNLQRLYEAGIPVPQPIHVERNILIMEFLGTKENVLPLLKYCEIQRPADLYKRLMKTVKLIYNKTNLVHCDLSEFNILFNENEDQFFIIDVSQSVLTNHPNSSEFLLRDLYNMNNYFTQLGVKIIDLKKLFKWVTGEEISEIQLYELKKK